MYKLIHHRSKHVLDPLQYKQIYLNFRWKEKHYRKHTLILMANLLCARFTRFLHLNPNHKSRFDNPIKHDLLEKDKTTLLFDTIIFPNNCLFTQEVVYQRCEFATQREFQLIFKSQYTCRFFCTETSQHEASKSFTKAI